MKALSLLIVILFFSKSVYCQDFTFAEVDATQIENTSDSLLQDEIFIYIIQNYEQSSSKTNIQHLEYEPETMCAFKQTFEYDITFQIDNCPEEGFNRMIVTFPKIEIEHLRDWIEDISNINSSKDDNKWIDNMEYGPKDMGAGCYYKIKEKQNHWEINRRCGC